MLLEQAGLTDAAVPKLHEYVLIDHLRVDEVSMRSIFHARIWYAKELCRSQYSKHRAMPAEVESTFLDVHIHAVRRDYQPSPQPSSSPAASLGLRSIFFFVAAGLAAAGFFAALDRPFGSGLLPVFFCACAANHPAKSGSEPSSNGTVSFLAASFVDELDAAGDVVACVSSPHAPSSSIASIPPQAKSAPSSSSGSESLKYTSAFVTEELRDSVGGTGDLTACRCRVEADDVAVAGRDRTGDVTFAWSCVDADAPLLADGSISPAAVCSLLVKDEIAQPAQDAVSLGLGVLMRGLASPVVGSGGNTESGMSAADLRTLCRYISIVLLACSRINFSLSISEGHMAGRIRPAQSSSLKYSTVAAKANRAAFRAWTKGSRSDLVKAAINTFDLVDDPRFLAILPRHMVVFVLMPGCSSLAVLARCFSNSPLMTRSVSLLIMTSTDLSVCSRTTGAKSVKPDT